LPNNGGSKKIDLNRRDLRSEEFKEDGHFLKSQNGI